MKAFKKILPLIGRVLFALIFIAAESAARHYVG